jgi:RsiW-degrading membrane proteinase PrsW (M82 family)
MTLALFLSVNAHFSEHPWAVRLVFLGLIILFALLWAVKNKFSDYP